MGLVHGLFALMAYHAPSRYLVLFGDSPVIASRYLIIFTGYACYKDLSKLIQNIETQKVPQVLAMHRRMQRRRSNRALTLGSAREWD